MYEEDDDLTSDADETSSSTDVGQSGGSSSNDDSVEARIAALEARAKKAEEERDSYKRGLQNREKEIKGEKKQAKKVEASSVEDEVLKVIGKQNERRAISEIRNPRSSSFIPELKDETQYAEVLGYLPSNIDRSTPEGITRAFKIAVAAWKYDQGKPVADDEDEKKPDVSDAAAISGSPSSRSRATGDDQKKPSGRRLLLKRNIPVNEWYSSNK